MNAYKLLVILIFVVAALGIVWFLVRHAEPLTVVNENISSIEECAQAGYPVMESYPRQCNDGSGNHFVEEIPGLNAPSYTNADASLIIVDSPRPGTRISSPLTITGEARGYWFFEAAFPIVLTNWDGLIIAEGFATAQNEWMTEDLVPFTATLTFTAPEFGERGTLILQRDNPSGLPEHDAAIEIPVTFE